MEPQWRAEWEAALHDLERSVTTAEQLLRGEPPASVRPWTPPPAVQGPPPIDLLPRVLELQQRHREVTEKTGEAMIRVARELESLHRSGRTYDEETPVYLDVRA